MILGFQCLTFEVRLLVHVIYAFGVENFDNLLTYFMVSTDV